MMFVVTMLLMSVRLEFFVQKIFKIFEAAAVQESAGGAKVKQYGDYIAPPYLSRFSSVFLFSNVFF